MSSVLASLNEGLHEALLSDDSVLVLGEDILDPYGGAFKVTRGLSDRFPERVITTPVSEAGFVGVACGLALGGFRPVVEVMFGDFSTLVLDQLVNHAAKFRWMYDDGVEVPLVVRTPMGGRRGYGPTHSQSLERLFLGVPGLRVLAATAFGEPGRLLRDAIADTDPVVFVESKALYGVSLQPPGEREGVRVEMDLSSGPAPVYRATVTGATEAVATLVAYGYSAELARQAMIRLAYQFEIFVELVVPTQLYPVSLAAVLASVERTGRLVVCEEASVSYGWGAEVMAVAAEALGPRLSRARRVGALDFPVPSSAEMEEGALPSVDDIVGAVAKAVA